LAAYLYDELQFQEVEDRNGNAERTKAGARKTDKNTLERLRADTDKQKEFKKMLKSIAALKIPVQNLIKMKEVCNASPSDPRLFAVLNQSVTDTHRLSSSARLGGLQFQNIERAQKRL